MGVLFIIVVIAAPKGLWGILDSVLGRFTMRKEGQVGAENATP
jgi:branched-chain amino acid transport system permease protein